MYAYSLSPINGVASAHRFMSLYNPSGSGISVVLHKIQCIPYTSTTSTSIVSGQVARVSTATGGTLVYDPSSPTDDVCKLRTSEPDSKVEIRTNNPTVTVGSLVSRIAPPIQNLTTTSYAAAMQELNFQMEWGRFTLEEEEGLTFHQTGAGDTSQKWPFLVVWSEVVA